MILKRISHIIVFLFLSILFGMKTYAQQTLVDVKLDSANIMIGQQTVLHLTITTDKGKQLIVPLPQEEIMKGVEVLTITPPDTTDIKNDRIEIKCNLFITSFDSALYLLPPFIAIDGKDTLYSQQVALKVISPDVNLDKPDEFYDIKDVWKPKFVFADYYPLIFGILFALILIGLIIYYIKRLRNRKPLLTDKKEEPTLPPYEQAIKELRALREKKLWQRGLNKEYYTEITETLRRYITGRYGISAWEKTSSEILDIIRDEEPGNKEIFATLKQILELSDFVKFAKMHPLPDENDLSMTNANLFVEKTRPIEMPTETKTSQTDTVKSASEDERQNRVGEKENDIDEDEIFRYAPRNKNDLNN